MEKNLISEYGLFIPKSTKYHIISRLLLIIFFQFRPKFTLVFLSGFLIINGNNGLANSLDFKPYLNKSTHNNNSKNTLEYKSVPSFPYSLSTEKNQFNPRNKFK